MSERLARVSAVVVLCGAALAGMPVAAGALTWTQEKTLSPSSRESLLLEVSCPSAGECVAVGTYYNATKKRTEPLIERLSGGTWTEESSASIPSSATSGTLNGVSCPSSSFCMASGGYIDSTGTQGFAEKYTSVSKKWEEVKPSLPAGASQSELDRVSCPSASMCMIAAVYSTGSEVLPFAEKWISPNTTSAEATPYPVASKDTALIGVSCVSSTECMAVGYTGKSSTSLTALSDRWSGGSWAQTTNVSRAGFSSSRLWGVDCLPGAAVSCTGVGWGTSSGKELAIAEEWTKAGGWLEAAAKSPSSSVNVLGGVGCTKTCIAVGYATTATEPEVLIERLEGPTATLETPAKLTGFSKLSGISCQTAKAECMAVGYYFNGTETKTLAESGK
jgi:putative hemolysin